MSDRGEMVVRLAQLHAADREWLLGQLPESIRAGLMSALRGEPAEPVAPPTPEVAPAPAPVPAEPADHFANVEPSRLAALLRSEPAWAIAAVVYRDECSWRDALLDALPARQRREVERAASQARRCPRPLADALVELLEARLAEPPPTAPPEDAGRFDALVMRLRGRPARTDAPA